MYICRMNFPSKLLENAVSEMSRLPGIGSKTALRLVLHLLQQPVQDVERLGESLIQLKKKIKHCEKCHNISDVDVCAICASAKREQDVICIVEDTRDVMAIENTSQYHGVYHVLGGLISPMDGIGPSHLTIDSLLKRLQEQPASEIILALSATMEGDTTVFYLYKKIKAFNVRVSIIARGIAFGGELEYVDEVTLGRSIATRVPYEQTL